MKKIIFILLLLMAFITTTNGSFVCHMDRDKIEELSRQQFELFPYYNDDDVVMINENDKPYLKLMGGVVLWVVCTSLTTIFVCRLIKRSLS